ncbi:hypothetical protein EZQ76_003066 [Escherichia coli]|nr:hypothetical protein [Escherichia coli]
MTTQTIKATIAIIVTVGAFPPLGEAGGNWLNLKQSAKLRWLNNHYDYADD